MMMSGLWWLLALACLLVVLFLLAILKPLYQNKKAVKPTNPNTNPKTDTPTISKSLQGLSEKLAQYLPEFRLISKAGTTERLLIKNKERHCATVMLTQGASTPIISRVMADVLIIELMATYDDDLLQELARQIRAYKDKTAQA
jgi:hypothetical protein